MAHLPFAGWDRPPQLLDWGAPVFEYQVPSGLSPGHTSPDPYEHHDSYEEDYNAPPWSPVNPRGPEAPMGRPLQVDEADNSFVQCGYTSLVFFHHSDDSYPQSCYTSPWSPVSEAPKGRLSQLSMADNSFIQCGCSSLDFFYRRNRCASHWSVEYLCDPEAPMGRPPPLDEANKSFVQRGHSLPDCYQQNRYYQHDGSCRHRDSYQNAYRIPLGIPDSLCGPEAVN